MKISKLLKSKFGIKPLVRRALRPRMAKSALDRRPALIVLLYHSIDPDPPDYMTTIGVATRPDAFEDHMRWARDHFEIVSLSEGIRLLRQDQLKQTCIAVTFDDGFRLTCDHALPILERYEIASTHFVNKAFLDGQRNWIYDVACLETMGRTDLLKEVFGSCNGRSYLSYLRWHADGETLARRQQLAQLQPELYDMHRMHFNQRYLESLEDHPLVEIGNHSFDHPRFSRLDLDEQRRQISENDSALAGMSNYKRFFGLPFGRSCDWNFDTVTAVAGAKHEFISGAGGINFASNSGIDIHRIPCDGAGVGQLEEVIIRRGLCI